MHNSITAEVAPASSPRFSILRSAEIMASGFLVSSTDPASASSSRDRDSASLTTCDSSQASRISAIAMMTTMTAPPPEPLLSLSEDDEDDEDEDEDDDAAGGIPAQIGEHPEEQLAEEADHAGDDHRDHHQLHVAVADVGELVAEHRLDLLIVRAP